MTGGCVAGGSATRQKEHVRMDPKEFFGARIYSRGEIDQWLSQTAFPWNRYDPELGYLLNSIAVKDGIDGAISAYTYADTGERLMIQHADKPCRINTYGNSVTQCHQVNDGETWQEYLAGHIGEPVKNFGIGGYSVYQAYLRMLREEKKSPADYIIFNLFIDDHLRTLNPWKAIRYDKDSCYFSAPQPHIEVDLETGACTPRPNPCPTPDDLYHLTDLEWVCDRFGNSLVARFRMKNFTTRDENPDKAYKAIMDLTTTHGVNTSDDLSGTIDQKMRRIMLRSGLIASMRIVDWIEEFAARENKKVLYILSQLGINTVKFLETGERWDLPIREYLEKKGLPVVDLMDYHAEEFKRYSCSATEYMQPYVIGHYTPKGNHFQAYAIKDKLVAMMNPKSPAYPNGVEGRVADSP
jgi:hypothetical protein